MGNMAMYTHRLKNATGKLWPFACHILTNFDIDTVWPLQASHHEDVGAIEVLQLDLTLDGNLDFVADKIMT